MFKKERLTELRESMKLTQQELADKLNISHVSVYNYESGKKEPGKITLKKIADYFNVSLDYLTGKSDIQELNEDLFGDFKDVMERLNNFDKEERKEILKGMLQLVETHENLIKKKK